MKLSEAIRLGSMMRPQVYAGAQAMFWAMLGACEPDDDAECEVRIEALGREMQDFLRLFKSREGV